MGKILKIGQFFRLIDENKQLSLTNIAVFIVLFKLAMAPAISLVEIGALFISLSQYALK